MAAGISVVKLTPSAPMSFVPSQVMFVAPPPKLKPPPSPSVVRVNPVATPGDPGWVGVAVGTAVVVGLAVAVEVAVAVVDGVAVGVGVVVGGGTGVEVFARGSGV